MGVAVATGDSARSFLGIQGSMWDTQSDMAMALLGSIMAPALLPGSTIDSYVEYGDEETTLSKLTS